MKFLARAVLRRVDKILGVPSDYLRFILDESWVAFYRFLSFMRFANFRQRLPREAWHIARIISTQAVDCGTCVQITVNLALRDRVETRTIQSVLDKRYTELSAE